MRQVVLTAPKQIEFREVAAPEAGNLKSDEVLLCTPSTVMPSLFFSASRESSTMP